MKNKGESVSNIIFGIIFLAVGGLLLFMRSEMTIVTVIAAADLLLGFILFIAGIAGLKKNSDAAQPTAEDNDTDWSQAAPMAAPVEMDEPEEQEEQLPVVPAAAAAAAVSVEALTARENELRKVVRQRRAEAVAARNEAENAAAAAAAAEQKLVDAENEMKTLPAAEQRAALARIDRMADEAMDLSQKAAVAARRAKNAERAYKEASDEHNKAMDAAADAMLEAEEKGWNANN